MYLDGEPVALTSGAGLNATNANEIGGTVSSSSRKGTFDMADLTIWNGGTTMTAAQVASWYYNYEIPTGPTLTHRYQHTDGSGTQLTDSVGTDHGTIAAATWGTSVPTKDRTASSARTIAGSRTVVA